MAEDEERFGGGEVEGDGIFEGAVHIEAREEVGGEVEG